jgi:TonB family protein
MYFDFEESHPEFTPVGRAISWREGVLISIIVHLALIILILVAPRFLPQYDRAQAQAPQRVPDHTQFVFVQPRIDTPALQPPDRGEASDRDRVARAPEPAPRPQNPLPFARGNTPERVIEPPREVPRGPGPTPDPAAGEPAPKTASAESAPVIAPAAQPEPTPVPRPTPPPAPQSARAGAYGNASVPGGLMGDALRNLQRSMRTEAFDNLQGGGGQFGPEIQFDTKGVEFGPWIRRFVAQVKRNWIIPYAAWSAKGRVVITFNVHKDGAITDLRVVGPSPIDALNNAAFGALSASNPTQPLPSEYPTEKAFFTVSFFYNESPER